MTVKNKHANAFGRTRLHFAVAEGDSLKAIARLLKKGAPVNAADRDGYTPLYEAVLRGEPEVIKLLLDAGADPAAQNQRLPVEQTLVDVRESIYLSLRATKLPRLIEKDYRTRYTAPCEAQEGAGGSIYRGNGVSWAEHPMRGKSLGFFKQYWSLYAHAIEKLGVADHLQRSPEAWGPTRAQQCYHCGSMLLLVIYASWGVSFNSGDLSWDAECYCQNCGWYSQWQYDE